MTDIKPDTLQAIATATDHSPAGGLDIRTLTDEQQNAVEQLIAAGHVAKAAAPSDSSLPNYCWITAAGAAALRSHKRMIRMKEAGHGG